MFSPPLSIHVYKLFPSSYYILKGVGYLCSTERCSRKRKQKALPRGWVLVLLVEDPDAPRKVFTHWLVYNIAPSTQYIREHEVPPQSTEGRTDFGTRGYGGPCPPSDRHRYVFQLFALDTPLALPQGKTTEEVRAKMKGHVIATAELVGTYTRG